MAGISQNTQRNVLLPPGGLYTRKLPMTGYTTYSKNNEIWHGSICWIDVSVSDGYVTAMQDITSVAAAAGDIFAGIAQEHQLVDSTVTADGAKQIVVARAGVWAFPVGGCAQTDIGAPAYASSDGVITPTSTNALWVGYIEGVDASFVYVNIEPAFLRTNTPT